MDGTPAENIGFSSPFLRGGYQSSQKNYQWPERVRFSSPFLRGRYRSEDYVVMDTVPVAFSSPFLRGRYRSDEDAFNIVINNIGFSSPFLRGGYRSDTLTNAITTIFQVSFLLSKNMTITSTRLYDMSLFLTNFIIITFILIAYYI